MSSSMNTTFTATASISHLGSRTGGAGWIYVTEAVRDHRSGILAFISRPWENGGSRTSTAQSELYRVNGEQEEDIKIPGG